jgi:hypothetical protein
MPKTVSTKSTKTTTNKKKKTPARVSKVLKKETSKKTSRPRPSSSKTTKTSTSSPSKKKTPSSTHTSAAGRHRRSHQQPKFYRFYDDSPDNIADVIAHGNIECVHVPRVNSSKKRYLDSVREDGRWDLMGQDADLQQVLHALKSAGELDEDASDALTSAHMSELRRFVRSKPKGTCRIMFDFDRVINRVEGMIAGKHKDILAQGLNVSGLSKYHIGSKPRLEEFRRTIDECLKYGAKVSVVTNNPGCNDETFIPVLHFIHPVFTDKNVHCSFRFANKLNCISAKKLLV